MSEEIFRKKSLDKVKSPETLDDYIRVSNPGVWLLLVSVIVLLAGAAVWGFFGQIETTVRATVTVEDGTATGFIADEEISAGMTVRLSGCEYAVASASSGGETGRLFCSFTFAAPLPDGTYEAEIVTGSVRPLSFVFN